LVVINNKYQDLEHSLDKRSRIEAMKDPDLNGADEVYDKDLCEFVNILSQLRPKASHLYIIILCNTDKWQKTYILNEKLSILSGLSVREISKGYDNKKNSLLNELEYWHLIERRKLPNPKYPKKQNRCITVHRWDKALELLKKDGKVIVDENGKITTRPNPFKE